MKAIRLFAILSIILSVSSSSYSQSIQTKYELEITKDIDYYKASNIRSPEAQLNIILPKGVENPPVLIWIGKGDWSYVDKDVEMEICKKMAEKGIAVISVGHRLSPQLFGREKREEGVQHPAHIKDIAQAFKWVYDNASKQGYNNDNIFVAGFSSGAHLAALLASDDKYLNDLSSSNVLIKGIIPIGGTYDIPHYREVFLDQDPSLVHSLVEPVFGRHIDEHLDASPSQFIDKLKTQMLLISTKDTHVYTRFYEKMLMEKKYSNYDVVYLNTVDNKELWNRMSENENNLCRELIVNYVKERSN